MTEVNKQQTAELILKFGDRIVDREVRQIMRPKEEGLAKALAEKSELSLQIHKKVAERARITDAMHKQYLDDLINLDDVNKALQPIEIQFDGLSLCDRRDYRIESDNKAMTVYVQLFTDDNQCVSGKLIKIPLPDEFRKLIDDENAIRLELSKVAARISQLEAQISGPQRQVLRDALQDQMTEKVVAYLNGDAENLLPEHVKEEETSVDSDDVV